MYGQYHRWAGGPSCIEKVEEKASKQSFSVISASLPPGSALKFLAWHPSMKRLYKEDQEFRVILNYKFKASLS